MTLRPAQGKTPPPKPHPLPSLNIDMSHQDTRRIWFGILKNLLFYYFKIQEMYWISSPTLYVSELLYVLCPAYIIWPSWAYLPPGVSKIKCLKNWASAVFDLSRSRNIGKYRKLAKYWQITPSAEQMAWTGGFLSFPQRSFHLATFFKTIIHWELSFIWSPLWFWPICEILSLVLTIYISLNAS